MSGQAVEFFTAECCAPEDRCWGAPGSSPEAEAEGKVQTLINTFQVSSITWLRVSL